MKNIVIELLQTNKDKNNEIVRKLKDNEFEIIEDTKNEFKNLRFITIDMELKKVEFDTISITLSSVIKPHEHVSIYDDILHSVDVNF